jgi:hypothetical protein
MEQSVCSMSHVSGPQVPDTLHVPVMLTQAALDPEVDVAAPLVVPPVPLLVLPLVPPGVGLPVPTTVEVHAKMASIEAKIIDVPTTTERPTIRSVSEDAMDLADPTPDHFDHAVFVVI